MKRLDLQFMQDEYSMGRWVGEWMDIVFMCIYLEASLDKINTRRRHRTRTCRAKQRPTNQVFIDLYILPMYIEDQQIGSFIIFSASDHVKPTFRTLLCSLFPTNSIHPI